MAFENGVSGNCDCLLNFLVQDRPAFLAISEIRASVAVRKGVREVFLRLQSAIKPDGIVALLLAQLRLQQPQGFKNA